MLYLRRLYHYEWKKSPGAIQGKQTQKGCPDCQRTPVMQQHSRGSF